MRERSTWNREEVMSKAAALNKKADPYTMNQDHPQPAHDKYVMGDPSTFAEDVHSPNTWDAEYANGQTKRNEIGMPEMRNDTFNHSEKTAKEVLIKKADLCIAVAQLMLNGKKTASESAIEDQAVALMRLADHDLLDTYNRLASEDEGGDDDDQSEEQQSKQAQDQGEAKDEDKDEGQAKQAGEMPDFIKEKMEEGKKDEDKKDDKDQSKQAQDQGEDDKGDEAQSKQASDLSVMASNLVASITANLEQQVQQMIQQAMGQQQQMAPQQAQQQMVQEDLDQMLAADDGCGQTAEADIQMEPAPMDVGMDDLGPEDEVLRTLFAQEDEEPQGDSEQEQKKQAGSVRTASTRTVGTRPTGGVSKIGGAASPGSNIDQLSNLWPSAPDVRDAFGLK